MITCNNTSSNMGENIEFHRKDIDENDILVKDVEIKPTEHQTIQYIRQKKQEYIESFTVHGLTRIFNGSYTERIFWLIVLLAGVGFSTFFVYEQMEKYLTYDINTEVRQVSHFPNHFPSVTFCDKSLYQHHFFRYCGKPYYHYNFTDKKEKEVLDTVCNSSRRNKTYGHIPTIQKLKQDHWSNGYFNVYSCHTWGRKSCTNDNYLKSLHRHDHVCFTWNYDGEFHDVFSHVKMVIAIKRPRLVRHNNLLYVFVHDSRVHELELTKSEIIQPNQNYFFRVSKMEYKRLPAPFPSRCIQQTSHYLFPGKYSRTICSELYDYITLYKMCGDSHDYIKPYIPQEIKNKYSKNITIREFLTCYSNWGKTTNAYPEPNYCPFPCEETLFTATVSSNAMTENDPFINHINIEDKENVDIYSIDMQLENVDTYRVIQERQLFTWDQIMGYVGGLLGLLIGASFTSAIEILTYLYLCVCEKLICLFKHVNVRKVSTNVDFKQNSQNFTNSSRTDIW